MLQQPKHQQRNTTGFLFLVDSVMTFVVEFQVGACSDNC